MSSAYEVVIGLEVHVELQTQSKIFCACPNLFGQSPNTNVCPVCLGLPGSLPVFNENVLHLAVKTALALNCQVASYSKFDRKTYFYPDLPKAYQISQYDLPLARDGRVDVFKDGKQVRSVGIDRLHMEEDAGKLLHDESKNTSYVDYNRSGVPLVEIVTAPDLRSPEEARLFLEALKKILLYTEVSDCRMEEGSLRCDANVSLRAQGTEELGRKVEIKNMNSFKAVQKGLEYEVQRQESILQAGGTVFQETRRWVEEQAITLEMRSKEEEQDYRYFPEPDLPPLVINELMLRQAAAAIPELPVQRNRRLIEAYGITPYQAEVLTSSKKLADYFEETLRFHQHPVQVANWILGDVLSLQKGATRESDALKPAPENLAALVQLVDEGVISGRTAKEVLVETFHSGQHPRRIVQEKGLAQIRDEDQVRELALQVIEANPEAVQDYLAGNKKAIAFLLGQIMKATRGQANPQMAADAFKKELDE